MQIDMAAKLNLLMFLGGESILLNACFLYSLCTNDLMVIQRTSMFFP